MLLKLYGSYHIMSHFLKVKPEDQSPYELFCSFTSYFKCKLQWIMPIIWPYDFIITPIRMCMKHIVCYIMHTELSSLEDMPSL